MAVVRDEMDIPMPAMGPASYRIPRRRQGMDPNTRRLALIAGSIGGVLVLLVGAWSVAGHGHGGVPVIEPDAGPVKVKPSRRSSRAQAADPSVQAGTSASVTGGGPVAE